MQWTIYREAYDRFFSDQETEAQIATCIASVKKAKRIFFIGNGGSNAITGHMMEDFGKMLRKQTFSFTDPSLITCYANDYGYEQAFAEWIRLYEPSSGDLLVAISSSGSSANILNAVKQAKSTGCPVITLSGFKESNPLRQLGDINVYVGYESYGVVETLHQLFLHIVLDEIYEAID